MSANGESSRRTITLPSNPAPPRPCLTNDARVAQWQLSPGFQGFWGWIQLRCDRIKGKEVMTGSYQDSSEGVRCLMDMLEKMTDWVGEVPPEPQSNQRFGNLAFRRYNKIVQERLPALLESYNLPSNLLSQLIPLLINSHAFGHPTRLDYGTGHELAFVLGLWCCVVSGWIGGEGKEDEEDELILRVFTRYLDLTTLLQQTYKLEPAGSHGVWGLDDYCFLPYLFGSAQLMDSDLSPSRTLSFAQSHKSSTPTSSTSIDPNVSSSTEQIKDLYTLSLHHLLLFKFGAAFSEHSPLLYSLSQFPDWKKPHGGLKKMFLGEVVGKRVVVQGLWVGGWAWGEDVPEVEEARREDRSGSGPIGGGGEVVTKAPWAR
ncbi:serine/threonine-protein phosphatase 2A activator 1 [Kwoniella shandongensis]|uniref:Serine/threonine-protein phosphatase 2A activator n=1 Tax=Kwoniella shandongensis TaxID=1734106 RepID=A0A5M6BNA9_9TREE|nr:serine/threonine-protein phosphatase 2A activator 1 [Kwoniella shandongensis]KAA5524338.1 serine/threonine-protein phosphatase 2A activator 1 [Kwoniella shandongensis]